MSCEVRVREGRYGDDDRKSSLPKGVLMRARATKKLLAALVAVVALASVVAVVPALSQDSTEPEAAPLPLSAWEEQTMENLNKAIAKDREGVEQVVEPLADTCATSRDVNGENIIEVTLSESCVEKVDDGVDEEVGVDIAEDGGTP